MNWPLAIPAFTIPDRLRIGLWLLRGKQWTQGPEVRAYEKRWEQYTGSPHAIMVSNGSVANELLARRRKYEIDAAGRWPFDNLVIFPACTWVSSVSPWIQEGFAPVWCDISTNLCASSDAIAHLLDMDKVKRIKTVFYTTLLGQATDLKALRGICRAHGAKLMLDNCESSFSETDDGDHFCSLASSSTSFYFSHPATTGTEGGMIFCEGNAEADWYRMMRSHGMTRGMPEHYRNPDAHPAFDFYLPGSNYRSSDLQAYMGSLVLDRSLAFAKRRMELAGAFYAALDRDRFVNITMGRASQPLMALPIVSNPTNRGRRGNVVNTLGKLGIEHRPIVGGNLLRHTAFKAYGDPKLYPRAQHLHDDGVYIGLHHGVSMEMVMELARELNR